MPKRLPELEKLLSDCSKILDESAHVIRESKLDSVRENITRIATALRNINEIRLQIYKHDPSLKPDFLNENLADPEQSTIFASLIVEAEDLCRAGKYSEAIDLYVEYVSGTPPESFKKLADAEVKRIKTIYNL